MKSYTERMLLSDSVLCNIEQFRERQRTDPIVSKALNYVSSAGLPEEVAWLMAANYLLDEKQATLRSELLKRQLEVKPFAPGEDPTR